MKINYLREWEDFPDNNINTIGDYVNNLNNINVVKTNTMQDYKDAYEKILSEDLHEIMKDFSSSDRIFDELFVWGDYSHVSFFNPIFIDHDDVSYDDININFDNKLITWKLDINDIYLAWIRSINHISYNSFQINFGNNVTKLTDVEKSFAKIINDELKKINRLKLKNVPEFNVKIIFKFTDISISCGSINMFRCMLIGNISDEATDDLVYLINSIEIIDKNKNVISGISIESEYTQGPSHLASIIDLNKLSKIKYKFKVISLNYICPRDLKDLLSMYDYNTENLFLTLANVKTVKPINSLFNEYNKTNNLYVLFNTMVDGLSNNIDYKGIENLEIRDNIFLWNTLSGDEYHINGLVARKLYNKKGEE